MSNHKKGNGPPPHPNQNYAPKTRLVEVFKTNPVIKLFDCQASCGHSDDLWAREAFLFRRAHYLWGGEGGKVLPFVTSLCLWITIGARKKISKWEFCISESQENRQETQFIPHLTYGNSALKKCSVRDHFTRRNEWCYLARVYSFNPAHFRIALRHVNMSNQWGLRSSPRGLIFSPWGLRFSPRGLRS